MVSRRRLIAGAAALGILWVLGGLGALRPLDDPVHAWVLAHRPPGSSECVGPLADAVMLGLAAVLAGLLRRDPRRLPRLAALLGAVAAAVWLVKHAGRAWPGWNGNNFPSGHATGGALLSLLLASTLIARYPTAPWRSAAQAACHAGAILFAVLAVYPLAHIPAEALGGYLLAVLAAQLGTPWIIRSTQDPPPSKAPT